MRKTIIRFSDQAAECIFPESRTSLPGALSELGFQTSSPVVVLVGGFIQEQHADATRKAIEVIGAFAEGRGAAILCGGSDLGVMAAIGCTRLSRRYTFPLLGINLERLVTWPGGPPGRRFLWWREEQVPLAPGYSHFLLVPGTRYGDDSPWIVEAADHLSGGNPSVTILANGGSVSRKDIALSLEHGRQVIALAGTGRLADELAADPNRPALVLTVPAEEEEALKKIMQTTISSRRIANDRTNER